MKNIYKYYRKQIYRKMIQCLRKKKTSIALMVTLKLSTENQVRRNVLYSTNVLGFPYTLFLCLDSIFINVSRNGLGIFHHSNVVAYQ